MKFKFANILMHSLIWIYCSLLPPANAGLIINNDNMITGVEEIMIDNELWTATFQHGTCINVYNGCDNSNDFPENLETLSFLMESLLPYVNVYMKNRYDQVYWDGMGEKPLQSTIELPGNGYELMSAYELQSLRGSGIYTFVHVVVLDVFDGQARKTRRLEKLDSEVIYVSWEISNIQNEVPEPSTLAIFALGMIGLASRRFKKQS